MIEYLRGLSLPLAGAAYHWPLVLGGFAAILLIVGMHYVAIKFLRLHSNKIPAGLTTFMLWFTFVITSLVISVWTMIVHLLGANF